MSHRSNRRFGTDGARPRQRWRAAVAILTGTALAASLLTVASPASATTSPESGFTPGARGIGDPYFPADGNGGFNVRHYGLELSYDPDTDLLDGVATIDIRATQNLSRFNLDFDGLTITSLQIDGDDVAYTRNNGELKITPDAGIPARDDVTVTVAYNGDPSDAVVEDGSGGWINTDDGVLVVGQPHVASTWFPVNDHPRDKAGFDLAMTVPDGLEAISNGALVSHDSAAGETRWVWSAPAPMAPYLATITIGEYNVAEYHDDGGRTGGIDYLDAMDPDLLVPIAPHTGTQMAISQAGQQTYKRLTRTIAVPGGGATMTFWVNRDTESDWDHLFVEARTVAQADHTTLPDANGNTSTDVGSSCPYWLDLHPSLTRYQTDDGNNGCDPVGTSGAWNAVSGMSEGWEQWSVDLGAFAGSTAKVSISYASDDTVQAPGVEIDDIEVSTGEGTTSFEADGNVMDGWTVPGAPVGSIANVNDWIVGGAENGPTPIGVTAQGSLDRQPEVISFLAENFGPYPFADSGAIIDDARGLGFALENQTRPVYAPEFFATSEEGDAVVVHELAHQWFGDRVALNGWKHIWLNEGFATYAEWLWSENENLGTAQEIFDFYYSLPANHPLWDVEIGDPGPDAIFDNAVYYRGAMTLHQLRLEVGDTDFFEILQRWAIPRPTRVSVTRNFIALAERVSGQELNPLFNEWLHTTHKPALSASAAEAAGAPAETVPATPSPGPSLTQR